MLFFPSQPHLLIRNRNGPNPIYKLYGQTFYPCFFGLGQISQSGRNNGGPKRRNKPFQIEPTSLLMYELEATDPKHFLVGLSFDNSLVQEYTLNNKISQTQHF